MKEPRILVIAKRDAHHAWKEALGDDVHCVTPGTPLYGSRFDLLIDDHHDDSLASRYQEWLNHVFCRLSPKGKYVITS